MNESDPKRLTPQQMLEGLERHQRAVVNTPPLGARFVGPPPPRRIHPAEDAFKTLKSELETFEAKLDDDHEIAIRIFGGTSLIHVQTIRFDPPDVLLFEGFTPEGDETLAIQHVAQLNLQLVKQPKLQAQAFRVGFILPVD